MINTEHYKKLLEEEKKTTEESLADIARFNSEIGTWEAIPDLELVNENMDDNDAADRFEDFEERTSIVNIFQARLTDINDALKKIEEGKYGICEISGAPIEEDRLNANPAARTCKAHMND
jgi:RNA polymerase-binding transcription factor DksA